MSETHTDFYKLLRGLSIFNEYPRVDIACERNEVLVLVGITAFKMGVADCDAIKLENLGWEFDKAYLQWRILFE